VATTPEPWILLPLIGMRREETYADYDHGWARRAIAEFRERVSDTGDGFDDELRTFVLRLYRRAAGTDATFFLDKTPRYHLIASEILDLFPGARALILWRNPLSIMASLIETWGGGHWNLYRYNVDLYRGLPQLVDLARQNRTNVLSVRYEELVTNEREILASICDHFGIQEDRLDWSIPAIGGSVGDPNQGTYGHISKESINKWKSVISNPCRKIMAKKYLKWLGKERLSVMGYRYDILVKGIKSVPTTKKYIFSDIIEILKGMVWTFGEYKIYKEKLKLDKDISIHHG
jgi:hypothetical protein